MFDAVKKISADEVLERLQDNQKLNLIDVRTKEEVAHGKIPGAQNIPLDQLPKNTNQLNKDKEYIMVCRSGGRSAKAAKFLKKNDFKVKNMSGGMMRWKGKVTKA